MCFTASEGSTRSVEFGKERIRDSWNLIHKQSCAKKSRIIGKCKLQTTPETKIGTLAKPPCHNVCCQTFFQRSIVIPCWCHLCFSSSHVDIEIKLPHEIWEDPIRKCLCASYVCNGKAVLLRSKKQITCNITTKSQISTCKRSFWQQQKDFQALHSKKADTLLPQLKGKYISHYTPKVMIELNTPMIRQQRSVLVFRIVSNSSLMLIHAEHHLN